jgi:tetratricopeptide (TPR) repeat protein
MSTLLYITFLLGANIYDDTFAKANAAYAAGDYAGAVQQYEQLAAESISDAALFYNLGNAYYRGGQIGPAIANYERALQLDPGLENARENLSKAVRETEHHLARPMPPDWAQSLLFWHYTLAPSTTYGLAAVLWCAFWILVGVRQWRRVPYTRGAAIGAGILVVAFGLSAWSKAHPENLAVAVDAKVPVHYSTSENDTVRFELYAGDRVTVDAQSNGWIRVTTADGERGWAQEKGCMLVGPPYAPPSAPHPAPATDGGAPS